MRLYLSSFRLGNEPEALLGLLDGRRRAAVVANAADYKGDADRAASVQLEFDALGSLGLEPFEVDLRDHFARPGELAGRLAAADLLWVRGGNTFILRRALRHSGADHLLPSLLAADAIAYAGYSAGVVVLTPTLRGIEPVDPPDVVPPGYDPGVVWDGLGILPHAVLPHYRSDHPESPAMERCVQQHIDAHVPFVALRDGQAIVRDGEREAVVG